MTELVFESARLEIERLRKLVEVRDLEIEGLRYDCTHDALTHLRNRLGFETQVGRWISDGVDVLTIGIFDLDDFKRVNDRRGHAAGDRVLCDVAEQTIVVAEAHHGIVARLSGDEFIIAVPGEDVKLAEDVVKGVTACELSLGVAVGLAVAVSRLMWSADVAMYRSKHTGGSAYTIWREGDKIPASARKFDRRRRDRAGRVRQVHIRKREQIDERG